MNAAASLAERVRALEALFERIAATRMQGVPVLHPGLRVAALGFEAEPGGAAAVGVLLTPWFMNLLWLPLGPVESPLAVGATRTRAVGRERFDFLGAHEDGFGSYECCSLFSPMNAFEDQAAAVATAQQVLLQLRSPPAGTEAPAADRPSRRAWLLGRGRLEAAR